MKKQHTLQISTPLFLQQEDSQKDNFKYFAPQTSSNFGIPYSAQQAMNLAQPRLEQQPASTKNANTNFKPLIDNTTMIKLKKIHRPSLKNQEKSRNHSKKGKVKSRIQTTITESNTFNFPNQHQIDSNFSGEGFLTTSSARRNQVISVYDSPTTKKKKKLFFNPKISTLKKIILSGASQQLTSKMIDRRASQFSDLADIPNLQEINRLCFTYGTNLPSQYSRGQLSKESEQNHSNKELILKKQMRSQQEEINGDPLSDREYKKVTMQRNSSKPKKKSMLANYSVVTNSIVSGGSNDQGIEFNNKVRIRPPIGVNNHIKIKQQQTNNPSIFSSPQKFNNLITTNLPSKNTSVLQSEQVRYFQNAHTLNKQKQDQNSTSKIKNIGQMTPLDKNWQTQSSIRERLIGSHSAKNLFQPSQARNKTQNNISINQQQFNNTIQQHNFDPNHIAAINLMKEQNENALSASQQIQAAYIKNFKLQNNFKLSFTNSFVQPSLTEKSPFKGLSTKQERQQQKSQAEIALEQVMELDTKLTESLKELQSQSVNRDSTDTCSFICNQIKRKTDVYLKIIDELIQCDTLYRPIISRVKKGFKECFKGIEQQCDKLRQSLQRSEFEVKEKSLSIKKLEHDLKDIETNEIESRSQMQNMAKEIDEREDIIEKLQYEILDLKLNARNSFKEKILSNQPIENIDKESKKDQSQEIDRSALYQQFEELLNENTDMKQILTQLQDELDYGKQRENKLMYFLFIMKEKGFPISEVFEKEIKDIPTTRFSNHFDDEYKEIYQEMRKQRKKALKEKAQEKYDGFGIIRDDVFAMISLTERVFSQMKKSSIKPMNSNRSLNKNNPAFESEMTNSFLIPLTIDEPQKQLRPSKVPKLDIYSLPKNDSDTSSYDDLQNSQTEKGKRGPNPRQLKKILDNYNIHTCARNLKEQERQVRKRRNQIKSPSRTSESCKISRSKYSLKESMVNLKEESLVSIDKSDFKYK